MLAVVSLPAFRDEVLNPQGKGQASNIDLARRQLKILYQELIIVTHAYLQVAFVT